MNRVLVTGASGFIGSHVVEEIAASGSSVRALVRKSSSLAFLDHPGVELAHGDVTDRDSLDSALSGVQGVVHCAGVTKAFSLDQYREINRIGTENLLRACCSASHEPSRIVCLSSLAAYGPSLRGRPVREPDEPHPVSDYGQSKLEGQQAAESFMDRLSITILIPPAVYGPRDRDIYAYFKFAKIGIVPFLGRRERYLSVIYVKDLARAAVECLFQSKADGGKYLIEDGVIHTWRSLARQISSTMGKRTAAVVIPSSLATLVALMAETHSRITGRPPLLGRQKMRELMQPSWTCTGEHIRRDLGFLPRHPLANGIEETHSWYRKHHWL